MNSANHRQLLLFCVASLSLMVGTACGKTVSGLSTNKTTSSCANATQGAVSSLQTTSTNNIIPVYIADPATTGSNSYANEPLVSVTICTPNHSSASQCQTISNILLDTGSYGLRVFGSALASNVELAQQTVTVSGRSLNFAECTVFGIGADWGSVQKADVVLGNQSASNIPIQVIDYNYASMPSSCASLSPDRDPCTAKFNGILGVGLFAQDCGADCNSTDENTNPGVYYACSSSGCYNAYSGACAGGSCAIPVPMGQQVINPISSLGVNGVSLTLPSVGPGGASQVLGSMTIGIPSTNGITVYTADGSGMSDGMGADFQTVFNSDGNSVFGASGGATMAFLDSGSNGLFFPAIAGLSNCSDGAFFCPSAGISSPLSITATIKGFSGSPSSGALTFGVVNADELWNSGSSAFSSLAGNSTSEFDWGLPFFYGRTVYVGISGKSATLNGTTTTGPYWAF